MRITVAAIGRLRRGPELDLVDKYRRLIRWPVDIREIELRRAVSDAEKRAREGALLLDAVPKNAVTIALDERGSSETSEGFAEILRRWRDSGRDIAFLIGGADGLDPEILTKADKRLAFGRMTWPHRLARGLLMEQLYRAQQILTGHPYHKG